ncbi:hypothetical protein [Methylomonas koyamae]|uniref:hypothetical protein n=1 Tax=Methylomonas koyamae TaxID=702114 RepID=UPI0011264273|nr:hypothetical protein [Methylomonas koyamae]TPQ29471.1 hypothetical protein C2U68_01570 [Methylomonas koyamae]
MFEAVSVILDLLILLVEFVGLCLKFILRKAGCSEQSASKLVNALGWFLLAVFLLSLAALLIKKFVTAKAPWFGRDPLKEIGYASKIRAELVGLGCVNPTYL